MFITSCNSAHAGVDIVLHKAYWFIHPAGWERHGTVWFLYINSCCRCSACFTVFKQSSKCSGWYLLEVLSGFLRELFSPMGKRLVKITMVVACNEWLLLWWVWTTRSFMTDSSPDEQARLHTQVLGSFLFLRIANLSVTDCVILSYLPASSKSKLLFSLFLYFMNFMNPIHQTFTASASVLHNSARAIKPHPKHVITSHPCIR